MFKKRANVAAITKRRRRMIADLTWHRWTPMHRPLVALNADPNAPATERYITLEHITYCNQMFVLEIPKGMKLDLASIPRPLWLIPGLSPTDRNYRAALAHDAMYRQQLVGRDIADRLLRSILKEDGVSWPVRNAIYWAVRFFGERAWTLNQERKFHADNEGFFSRD